MQQAVTRIVVCVCLVLAPRAWADGPGSDATAAIAQARRLIGAGDHSRAIPILEDALLEARAEDRPTILDLLRQSYEVMARQAESSGRAQDAAHYRDNLAILDRGRESTPDRSRGTPAPSKPAERKPETPARPKPARTGEAAAQSVASPVPSKSEPKPTPLGPITAEAPAAMPEPTPLPAPGRIQSIQPAPVLSRPSGPTRPSSLGSNRTPVSPVPDRMRSDADVKGADAPGAEVPSAANPGSMGDAPTEPSTRPISPNGPRRPPSPRGLDEADQLYLAKRYDEAGRRYAALARQNQLPANRKENWAYCRSTEVVRKINARPRSARQWDEIEGEIRSIQRLAPNVWLGEYLRSKVVEARRGGRRAPAQSGNLVVRGSEPEETRPQSRRLPRLFGKSRGDSAPQPDLAVAPASAPAEQPLNLPGGDAPPQAGSGSVGDGVAHRDPSRTDAPGRSRPRLDTAVTPAGGEPEAPPAPAPDSAWQVHETPNFRILHQDRELAERAAEVAESVRAAQVKRWGSPAARGPWTPRCELYLYPTAKAYAQATGQPEISPGISTMYNNGVRVVGRRMNLRADYPRLLTAILPHEVTHIVLADLFILPQIPRWADEGVAVLAEPLAEQHSRISELQEPLESGRVFKLDKLMAMDLPDEKDWRLYYAQSVSVTRFLVEQGPPERFIKFVRDSQHKGTEAALRDVYQIDGFRELQDRWMSYAKEHIATATASGRDPNGQPPTTERR